MTISLAEWRTVEVSSSCKLEMTESLENPPTDKQSHFFHHFFLGRKISPVMKTNAFKKRKFHITTSSQNHCWTILRYVLCFSENVLISITSNYLVFSPPPRLQVSYLWQSLTRLSTYANERWLSRESFLHHPVEAAPVLGDRDEGVE